MTVTKPYKRTIRQLVDNSYANNGNGEYVEHPEFALAPAHYLRAFNILLKDFKILLDYIEPDDINLDTYSYRIHELLFRTCIEIEANFVAILEENGYSKSGNWNMTDFKKINITHHLSAYKASIPNWRGEAKQRQPFETWTEEGGLEWFKAYNKTKHNRQAEFEKANFKNLTDSLCALAIVLASQFSDNEFVEGASIMVCCGGDSDGMNISIGDFFRIKFPDNWEESEKYDFKWSELKQMEEPIQKYNYNE